MNTFHVSIRFLEPLLGTAPLNAELYRQAFSAMSPSPFPSTPRSCSPSV